MASTEANGITIEYEIFGRSGPPLLLIAGLGAQLVFWDEELVQLLAKRGFQVIVFDNRDVGLSRWFDDAGVPDVMAVLSGSQKPPYLLEDMADDAAGLLGGLGIESAHVLGLSMGGMIAQCLSIWHPSCVRTLTSVMSTTGDAMVGAPHGDAVSSLLAEPPADRESAIESSLVSWRILGSPGYPMHEERIAASAGVAFDRAFHPDGTARQLVAILASPDRTPGLEKLEIPTLVIHGDSDPLVDPSGGEATVWAVPDAELWMVPDMGHDLPPEIFEQLVERLATHCGL